MTELLTEKREALSRARIVEAAIRLVDREGADALSMRRLGSELGVRGMSLYNHVPNKEALVNDVVRAMFAEIAPMTVEGGHWKEQMRAVMRSFRQVGLKHPNVFALYSARPASPVERTGDDIATLRQAGFTREHATYALRSLSSFVVGFVAREVAGAWSAPSPNASSPVSLDEVFEYGLSALLDGLEVSLARDTATQ